MPMKVCRSKFGTVNKSEGSTKKVSNMSDTDLEVVASLRLKLTLNDKIHYVEYPEILKNQEFLHHLL